MGAVLTEAPAGSCMTLSGIKTNICQPGVLLLSAYHEEVPSFSESCLQSSLIEEGRSLKIPANRFSVDS
eukprot:179061-Amphidinium_carterae.1